MLKRMHFNLLFAKYQLWSLKLRLCSTDFNLSIPSSIIVLILYVLSMRNLMERWNRFHFEYTPHRIPPSLPCQCFWSGDLDLWPMTLTSQLDLDILPLDLHAKIQVRMSVSSAVRAGQTNSPTRTMSKLLHPTCHVTDVGCKNTYPSVCLPTGPRRAALQESNGRVSHRRRQEGPVPGPNISSSASTEDVGLTVGALVGNIHPADRWIMITVLSPIEALGA